MASRPDRGAGLAQGAASVLDAGGLATGPGAAAGDAAPAGVARGAVPEDLVRRRPSEQVALIERAWAEAGRLLPPGPRERGLDAARVLADLNLDHETVAAALVHPAVTAGALAPADLSERFGEGVARLLEGVGRMDALREYREAGGADEKGAEQARLEGLRKLLLAMAEDLRVILVRLAEQVTLLRSLRRGSDEARRPVARETLDIYAPLANRLGIWQMKWELEDLSFRFLEPDKYQGIARRLDERRSDRERYIQGAVERLRAQLAADGIRAEVTGRPKHIFSIWRKMQAKGVDFDELFDVRAVRVLVDTVKDCYAALGVVHGLWQHIPREFDDYIASPKGNSYQSLHTAVVGPGGRTLEVQIRTHEMHRHAELGVAAHWQYKEGGRQDPRFADRVAWLRQLLEVRDEGGGASDLLERFKTEVFHDRVYVLTPKGRVVDLPRGATPLDFAYAVHSEVGHRCRGAKVGGSIVPLTYELRNGDQVEILTARQGGPSRDWLNQGLGYLKTSRARGKVRQWFKQQDYDKCVASGRDQLDRELRRLGVSEVNLERLAQRLRFPRVDDLCAGVGRGEVSGAQIAGALQEEVLPAAALPERKPRPAPPAGGGGDVTVEGVGNLMTHMARCCKPVPPDPISGYITHGRGVTIHRQDCPNVLRLAAEDGARLIDVTWSRGEGRTYPVDIQVEAYDRQGLLRDVGLVLASEKVNVIGVNTFTDRETSIAQMRFTIEVPDAARLARVLARLTQLHNVIDVRRRG
jgi:GTP pyrophosphokinase